MKKILDTDYKPQEYLVNGNESLGLPGVRYMGNVTGEINA